jgi:hypothetical protein
MSGSELPYRTAADAARSDLPSRELVYARRVARGGDGVRTLYWLFGLPMTLAAIGGAAGSTAGATAGLLIGGAIALSRWRWREKAERTTLIVERGVLTIAREVPGGMPRQLVLQALANVILHHREVSTVVDGRGALPWQRFADANPGPKLDKAQVVLVDASGLEMRLAMGDLPNFEATEWLGKIRRFLRSHGWVPEDERPEVMGE